MKNILVNSASRKYVHFIGVRKRNAAQMPDSNQLNSDIGRMFQDLSIRQ